MIIKQTLSIPGKHGKPILLDYRYPEKNKGNLPVVIFCHGFKGFKDWGHFNMMADLFAENGFFFIKHNFSFNGTTVDKPDELNDLQAFGHNNLGIELDDLDCIIEMLEKEKALQPLICINNIYLIGHSRGGGVAVIKASEDTRIKKVVTWSAVSKFEKRIAPEALELWKIKGVRFVENKRTGQQMPIYYQFHEDFYNNRQRYDVARAASVLKIPFLIIHGTGDEAVPFEESQVLKDACPAATLIPVNNAGHTFGIRHPFDGNLTDDAKLVIESSIRFLQR